MTLYTRQQLRASGVTDRGIAAGVAAGSLIRLRGGLFADRSVEPPVRSAVVAGGRLACASELHRRGVWILDERLHVHFTRQQSSVVDVAHWGRLAAPPQLGAVATIDAVAQALQCLDTRQALAAVDSALHLRLVTRAQIAALRLSARATRIVTLADPRAESGLESFARLLALELGLRVETQVAFDGVGRVDLVINDAVVVEADGDQFHSDAQARRRDRRRDALLAATGRPVLRFGYDQLVGRPAEVARALISTVAATRAVKDSRAVAARAWKLAEKHGWA